MGKLVTENPNACIFLIFVLLLLFLAFLAATLWLSYKSEKRKNILHDLYQKYQNLIWLRDNLKANLEKTSNECSKLKEILNEYKIQYPDFKPSINAEEDSQSAVTEETQPTSTGGPKSKEEVSKIGSKLSFISQLYKSTKKLKNFVG